MNKLTTTSAGPPARADFPALVEDALSALAPATQAAYKTGIVRLAQFLELDEGGAINGLRSQFIDMGRSVANQTLLRWKGAMKQEGLAASTINLRLAAARFLVSIARIGGLIEWSVEISGVKAKPYRDMTGPGLDAINVMIKEATPRDKAILMLLYTAALRKHEICSLDLEHYDSPGHRLYVKRKGRQDREWVALPGQAEMALDEWLEIRGDAPGPLFTSRTGRRLEGTAMWRIVKRYDETTSPHRIRHTATTDALEATNGDVSATAAWRADSNVNTAQIYNDNRANNQLRVSQLLADRLEV